MNRYFTVHQKPTRTRTTFFSPGSVPGRSAGPRFPGGRFMAHGVGRFVSAILIRPLSTASGQHHVGTLHILFTCGPDSPRQPPCFFTHECISNFCHENRQDRSQSLEPTGAKWPPQNRLSCSSLFSALPSVRPRPIIPLLSTSLMILREICAPSCRR